MHLGQKWGCEVRQPARPLTKARAETAVSSERGALLPLLHSIKSQPLSPTLLHMTLPIPCDSFMPSFFTPAHTQLRHPCLLTNGAGRLHSRTASIVVLCWAFAAASPSPKLVSKEGQMQPALPPVLISSFPQAQGGTGHRIPIYTAPQSPPNLAKLLRRSGGRRAAIQPPNSTLT